MLASLADLQGRDDDPTSEEQPGRILHELRRHGGSGAFSSRSRYYGTVDATPLFVGLAAEAWRWRAIDHDALRALAPAVGRAVDWVTGPGDSDGDGFLDYRRRHPQGLANQGWKDSWDGITRADGTLPDAPLALVEVQGYAYAALRGAATLAEVVDIGHHADDLRRRAEALKDRFNDAFWDPRGYFVLGLDADGRPIDSLTTNPGHALWSGIADDDKARRYVERLTDPDLWTGWGLRTLARSMGGLRPVELPQRLGVAARHRTLHRRRRALRLLGRRRPPRRRCPGGDAALRRSPSGALRRACRATTSRCRWPTRRPAHPRPGRRPRCSCWCGRCWVSSRPRTAPRVELVRPDLTSVPDLSLERLEFAGHPMSVHVSEGRGRVMVDLPQ